MNRVRHTTGWKAAWAGQVTWIGLIFALVLTAAPPSRAQANGYSLRFYGHGAGDVDRVKIKIDAPAVPADIGATDWTLEFWMKANASDNTAGAVSCGANVNWIYGNIVFDRDRYNRDRKFGLAIAGGKLVFGVSGDGTGDTTICGTSDILNGQWHHVAVERRRSDGWMWMYVDGIREAEADGPDGDMSYPDGAVPGAYCGASGDQPCVNDPYLVIGAEKHDAGSEYPSYSGFIDEVRLSDSIRYSADFSPPSAPFVSDASTVALYHFDQGPAGACSGAIQDSSGASGGPSDGACQYGGVAPAGPLYTTDVPFAALDTQPPVISNVTAAPLDTSAAVAWLTDEPATSLVMYGISPTLSISTPKVTSLTSTHRMTLSPLSPNTWYVYRVHSQDGAGNPSVSPEAFFVTRPVDEMTYIYLPMIIKQ